MATVKDVILLIEEIAPLTLSHAYCEKYNAFDNSGLIIGSEEKQVFTVLCCLDVTTEVVMEAEELNADMIISHHPVIYGSIKKILTEEPQGRILGRLLKNGISVYSAHLNLDVAPYGINQLFADRLGMINSTELQSIDAEDAGLGRIGELSVPQTLAALCEQVSAVTGDINIKTSGDLGRMVTFVAVACGACGGDTQLLHDAHRDGAEVFITSEIKHHVALYAKEIGLCLIDAGHHATEYFAMETVCRLLSDYAEERAVDIEFIMSAVNTNPFNN